jgi:DNA processing protein
MTINARELLVLHCIPGIGLGRLRSLLNHFGSTRAVLKASGKELIAVEGIEKKTAGAILSFLRSSHRHDAEHYADSQLSRLNRVEGRLVSIWDGSYPDHLRRIYDPPPFLFVRGTLLPEDDIAIAVVGTRNPSEYGRRVAGEFADLLARSGFTVISGLAKGIDTTAHSEALKAGGRTVAVIGSGVDVIYPHENNRLAEKITRHGAVISEFEMGAAPDAVNFPRRNRIISGMSLGTLVVETGVEGGAMITAKTALEQNREVFAVPGPLRKDRQSGTHLLIKEGHAKLTEDINDIISDLEPGIRRKLSVAQPPQPPKPAVAELTLFEERILAVMDNGPTHVDTIAVRSGLSASETLIHLLSLEFKDVVRQRPGKQFMKI